MAKPNIRKWRLLQIDTHRVIEINETSTVGRNDTAKVCLRSNKASRNHATLIVNVEGNLLVQDIKSGNGTYINGTRISVSDLQRVFPGDIIGFGIASMDVAEDNRDRQCIYKVILEEQPPPKEIINGPVADSTTEIDSSKDESQPASFKVHENHESSDIIEISSSTNDNPEVINLPELEIANVFSVMEEKPLNTKEVKNTERHKKNCTVQKKQAVGTSNCSEDNFQSTKKTHQSRRFTIHVVHDQPKQTTRRNDTGAKSVSTDLREAPAANGTEKVIIRATNDNDFGELVLQANNIMSDNKEKVEKKHKIDKGNKSGLNKKNNKTGKASPKLSTSTNKKDQQANTTKVIANCKGLCEEVDLCNDNIKPSISRQNNTNLNPNTKNGKTFTVDNDNSIIIDITDDDDDMDFSSSQIFHMSQVVKVENEDDIYNKIKNELAEMDFCNEEVVLNTVPINLDDEFERSGFENTQDICEFLQDGIERGSKVTTLPAPNNLRVSTDVSCLESEVSEQFLVKNSSVSSEEHKMSKSSEKRQFIKPPIIKPHIISKPVKTIKQTPEKIASDMTDKADKGTNHKRKSSMEAPNGKKKIKSNQKSPSNCKPKDIALEFKRRRSSSVEMDKAKKVSITEESCKKLKELASYSLSKPEKLPYYAEFRKLGASRKGLLNDNISKETAKTIKIPTDVNRLEKPKSTDYNNYNLRRAKSSEELKVRKQNINGERNCLTTRHSTDVRIQPSTSVSVGHHSRINSGIDPRKDQLYINQCYPKMSLLEMEEPFRKNEVPVKTSMTRRLANVDDITKIVIQWLPLWLREQVSMDYSPPVNTPPATNIPTNFRNFTQYYNTFSKLVLLENWQYLFKGFRESTEQPRKVKIEHVRISNDVMTLDCVCYISREELRQGLFYKPEDVVLFECVMNDQSNCYMSLNFGFVQNCRKTTIPNDGLISVKLGDLCPGDPHTKLEFTVLTRYQPEKEINSHRTCIIKLLANIRGHLMLIRAIKGLKQSPLCSMIMKPEMNDYKFSITHRNIIHPHNLNPQQKTIVLEAASLCTGQKHGIYCVKGPPGTGKSTVIVNLIFQILFSHKKHGGNSGRPPMILLAAPSNTAVDSLITKLVELKHRLTPEMQHQIKLVRIGPESSISKEVMGYSLPKLAEKHVPLKNIDIPQIKAAIERKENMVEYSKNFFKDQYNHELKLCENIVINKSNIICTTLNSCINGRLINAVNRRLLQFTCCIIDEATQCHEVEALLPTILGIDKFVLVGDPQQLNATVMSRDALKLGFDQSLFTRLANNFGNDPRSPIKMLTDQYRMHPEICEFPNKQFYEGKLRSFPQTANKLPDEIRPYLVFNCEKVTFLTDYTNIDEIYLIKKLLSTIFSMISGDRRYTVGIITPYNAQKDLICSSIVDLIEKNENVKITTNTVDSFQGSEFDIVIISCVRDSSNSFLQNENRLNVALTRAKQALYIIGNYTLFKECRPLYDLREDAKRRKVLLDIKQNLKSIRNFNKFLLQKKST